MKFLATLTTLFLCLQAVYGFQPIASSSAKAKATTSLKAENDNKIDNVSSSLGQALYHKTLVGAAATTGWMMSMGIDPAFAAKEEAPPMDYIGKDFTAQFLPAIMVPLVGLVFPAFSMALFFLYSQDDDI